jgi:hypothetical protein
MNLISSTLSFLIRRPPDHSLFPAPRSISLVTTSFIASECQGIPHKLFLPWISCLEVSGVEPLTIALQRRCSTNWAIPPWAILDLNQRPHPYQGCALANWANSPLEFFIFRIFSEFKEVIQPHLPVRLPCYDFTPVTNSTLGVLLQKRLD